MFSNESLNHADMCRFCWMCRHICPVAGATGSEGWGPRSRGLMVSMIERGTEYDSEIADAMFHCTMCDACANDCATNWKPSLFTREARKLAVVNDIAPKAIMDEIDNIMSKGNIYGEAVNAEFKKVADALPEKAGVLLYVGQTGRTFGYKTALAAISLLKKAGVDLTVLSDEKPTGAFLGDLMGFTGDVQNVAKACAADIAGTGAKTVVALAPYDAVMLKEQYAEWKLLDGVEVVSAPAFIASLIAGGKLKVKSAKIKASLQEPVKLTRGLDETEPLLDIVKALGIDYVPLFLNGKMGRCIGTPLMEMFDANVVKQMVRVRMDDARRIESPAIIAASADDMYLMDKYKADDMAIYDIFELLDSNC